jgi:hypothetical protein
MREMYAHTKLRCVRCAKDKKRCSLTGSGSKGEVKQDDDDIQIVDPPHATRNKVPNAAEKRKVVDLSPTASHSLDSRPVKKLSRTSLSSIRNDDPGIHDLSMGPPPSVSSSFGGRLTQQASRSSFSGAMDEEYYDSTAPGPPFPGPGSSYSFPDSSFSRPPSTSDLNNSFELNRLRKLLQESQEDLLLERRRRAEDVAAYQAKLDEIERERAAEAGWKGKGRA